MSVTALDDRTDVSATRFADYRRSSIFHGILLNLAAFVSAFFMGLYANPRTGLAAHLVGITEGLLLIAVGLIFPMLRLSNRLAAWTYWLLVVSFYVGFIGELLGAIFGLTDVFVVTAAGRPDGPPLWEMLVGNAIKLVSPTTLLPMLFILWGLRRAAGTGPSTR